MSNTFDQIVRNKMAQKPIEYTTPEELGNVTMEGVAAQKFKEEMYYKKLSAIPTEAPINFTDLQEQTLIPKLGETESMKNKHRKSLRKRTLKNYKEGREKVGDMATAQTVPLMKSISDYKKNIEKQKLRVAQDMRELSQMEIPSDIFDVVLTKEHSHFDVKRALRIKEGLSRIDDYKTNSPEEYALLEVAVKAKLDMLLEMKEPFEKTLKTVLAANGLNEDGTVASKEEQTDSRLAYDATKEAFKEKLEGLAARVGSAMATEASLRLRQVKERGTYERNHIAMRDSLIAKWDSFRRSADNPTGDPDWIPIPEGYVNSTNEFYTRASFQLDDTDEEFSYERLKREMLVFKLQSGGFSGDDAQEQRERAFAVVKESVAAQYDEARRTVPALVRELKDAPLETLLARQKEVLSTELTLMHLSDLAKKSKDAEGKSAFDMLGLSAKEERELKDAQSLLSVLRRKLSFVAAMRASDSFVGDFDATDLDMELRAHVKTNERTGHVDKSKLSGDISPLLKTTIAQYAMFASMMTR